MKTDIKKIKQDDADYPEGLKHIFKAPEALYVKGSLLPEDSNSIAIVGTRRATYRGLENAEKLAHELAVLGITVISGMARGIDSAAHRGAIRAGGRTIAVMGSGHAFIYPSENKALYKKIAENGAVISEFPNDTPPIPANFPRRNRIISGMSKGVVVVEAPLRSGALITADFALEQGREVFAMPGSANSAGSSGANRLIKEGAKLTENVSDILEELKISLSSASQRKTPNPGAVNLKLEPEEKTVLEILTHKPKSIDEIIETTNLQPGSIRKALLKMELKKLVVALPGENFARKQNV